MTLKCKEENSSCRSTRFLCRNNLSTSRSWEGLYRQLFYKITSGTRIGRKTEQKPTLSNWNKKTQNSQKHTRVTCETYRVVFSLCSTVKSSAGMLCRILFVSREMWVIGIKEKSETEGI